MNVRATAERRSVPRAFRSISHYSLSIVVQRASGILLLPLYTHYLSRADYGVLELLDLIWTVAALVVSVQLSTALFFYYHRAESETEQQRDVVTSFIGMIILSTIVGVAGTLLAPPISRLVFGGTAYTGLIRVVLLGLSCNLLAEFGFSYLRLRDRTQEFMSASFCRVASGAMLNVLFLSVFGLGVSSMPWSSLITTFGLLAFFSRDILLANSVFLFHWPTLRKMTLYGMPLGVGMAGEIVLHMGDRPFLSKFVSLADLGLYGLAYKFGMLVSIAGVPFFNYWNSQMMRILLGEKGEETYIKTATYLLLGLTFVVLFLTVFIDPILTILVDASFRRAARLVPWIALAYLFRGMGHYWSNTFLLVNRPTLAAQVTWIGAGACLLAYALLIPRYGLWGAVGATHLGFALMAFFALWRSQRIRPFRYEYGRWTKILACGALSALPSLILHPSGFSSQTALGFGCLTLFPFFLWLTRFPTGEETQTVIVAFRNHVLQWKKI